MLTATNLSAPFIMVWRALAAVGVTPRPVFEKVGLDPDLLYQPGARYPVVKAQRVWAGAVEASGEESIGLAAARLWHPSMLHALGYTWQAAASLKEGMEDLVRYSQVVTTAASLEFREEADGYRLAVIQSEDSYRSRPPAAADMGFGMVVQMCRVNTGTLTSPLMVVTTRRPPARLAPYEDFYRAQLQFGATEDYMVFDRDELDRPLPTGNAELARANEKVIVDYLGQVERQRFDVRVHSALIELLPHGKVSQVDLADALHVSVRTLQRRLDAEGTTYQSLLARIRLQLAEGYLRDRRHSLSEITYLLGFSDQANFGRAFKRWTSTTPREFREQAYHP